MAGSEGKSKGGGAASLLVPLVAVTIIGGGGGAFLGFSMFGSNDPAKTAAAGKEVQSAPEKADAAQADGHAKTVDKSDAHGDAHGDKSGDKAVDAHGGSGGHGDAHGKDAAHKADAPAALQVKELPPLVTNLGGDKRNWVRLQSAIVYDPHELQHAETLIPALMSDITAFISTLDLSAIEGPDGLRRLQEELNERAATRSDRHIREFIIETLVVQ